MGQRKREMLGRKARPIRRHIVKPLPIPRVTVTDEQPLTPGLRRREYTNAIGFHVDYICAPDDDEGE